MKSRGQRIRCPCEIERRLVSGPNIPRYLCSPIHMPYPIRCRVLSYCRIMSNFFDMVLSLRKTITSRRQMPDFGNHVGFFRHAYQNTSLLSFLDLSLFPLDIQPLTHIIRISVLSRPAWHILCMKDRGASSEASIHLMDFGRFLGQRTSLQELLWSRGQVLETDSPQG